MSSVEEAREQVAKIYQRYREAAEREAAPWLQILKDEELRISAYMMPISREVLEIMIGAENLRRIEEDK